MAFSEGTVVRGRYRIEGVLGRGGMGIVYAARHLELDRSVALKALAGADKEYIDRFRREAKVLSALNHPNVVQVLDYFAGDAETPPYLVMERLFGKPLNEAIGDGGPMTESRVIDVGLQLTDAISAAHAKGVIHRDVKPGNVLLTETTLGRDALKLLDFGVARDLHATDDLTREGLVVGTLAWLSPEQITGRPADVQSDIYAIGAVLYFCLFGRKPFAQSAIGELAAAIIDGRHDRAASMRPGSAIARVIDRAMALDRSRRYATAAELGQALKDCLDPSKNEDVAPASAAPTRIENVVAPSRRRWWIAPLVIAFPAGIALAWIRPGSSAAPVASPPVVSASAPIASNATIPAPVAPEPIVTHLVDAASTTSSIASAKAPARLPVRAWVSSASFSCDDDQWNERPGKILHNPPASTSVAKCSPLLPDDYSRSIRLRVDASGAVVLAERIPSGEDDRGKPTPAAFVDCLFRAIAPHLTFCPATTTDRTVMLELGP